ncbi:MAG: hypothetical protein KDI37_05715 [Xanthomonadales bacterium]|nr:hypothetical protein [Xanthomonadales bacterium]
MAHARKAIRAAIKSHLSGATSMGTRVHANRLHPFTDAEMPCINLEMTADRIDQSTVFAPLGYIRTVTVDVVIKAKAAVGVDDVLDDLCAEVEPLMVDVPGIEDQLEFVGTTMGLSQSLEQPCGEARMTYQIHYQTAASDPGTAL